MVLPAPFGPIRAVIEPSATSSVAPSTARIPPKRLTTSRASKIGPPLLRACAVDPAAGPSVTKHHLLALAEHPLWPEGHQQDQNQADDREAKRDLIRLILKNVDVAGCLE